MPISVAVDNIAKRIGADVRFVSGVYYVGGLGRTDSGTLVRRVRGLSGEELREAVESQLSDTGNVVAYDDGLCVVADVVAVLDRVGAMLDQVEELQAAAWVVQLHVIAYEYSAVDDLGVDVVPAARLAAIASADVADVEFQASLEAVLRAVVDRGDVHTVAEPMLLLADGERSTYDRGQTIPFVTQSVETVGASLRERQTIDFLDVGFELAVELRELTRDSAAVTVVVGNSRVIETGEGLPPTVSRDNLESVVPVVSGGVYLAGSFVSERIERSKRLGLSRGREHRNRSELYQVWLRCYKIGAGGVSTQPIGKETTTSSEVFEPLPIGS